MASPKRPSGRQHPRPLGAPTGAPGPGPLGPPPPPQPVEMVKFTTRIPADLKKELAVRAVTIDVSVEVLVERALRLLLSSSP